MLAGSPSSRSAFARSPEPGQPLGQRGQECVAAPPVDRVHSPQVPVELAAGDEVGQGELFERGRAAVGGDLGRGHRPARCSGITNHPRRSLGARVLLADPA